MDCPSDDTVKDVFVDYGNTLPEDILKSVREFWREKIVEISREGDLPPTDFAASRIRRIIKTDDDVELVSGEVPVMFSKVCEMLVAELTARAWAVACEKKKVIIQREDIVEAISKNEEFDFLIDLVSTTYFPNPSPTEEQEGESGDKINTEETYVEEEEVDNQNQGSTLEVETNTVEENVTENVDDTAVMYVDEPKEKET